MSILFLNILTLLAPTPSADNVFHSFTTFCENGNFLISSLHCFFANVTPCQQVLDRWTHVAAFRSRAIESSCRQLRRHVGPTNSPLFYYQNHSQQNRRTQLTCRICHYPTRRPGLVSTVITSICIILNLALGHRLGLTVAS